MKSIDNAELLGVVGGMQWEQFRRSTHVEDRRPAWAIKRDDAWFRGQERNETHVAPAAPMQNVPLPPRRPPGL